MGGFTDDGLLSSHTKYCNVSVSTSREDVLLATSRRLNTVQVAAEVFQEKKFVSFKEMCCLHLQRD